MSQPMGYSILLHGPSKAGKSSIFDTSPAPRLHLDAEGGASTRFTPSKKVYWDPVRDNPPDTDETCVVYIRDYQTLEYVYKWVNSGKHPFRSIGSDSISEVQQRGIDSIAGTNPMKTQDWGELLRSVDKIIRDMRDLINHPSNPLSVVAYTAMTTNRDGKWRPYVQGQLIDRLPYRVDICGYVFKQRDESGSNVCRMLVDQHEEYEAGHRLNRPLGPVIDRPNLTTIYEQINAVEDKQ
jgi:hypothetical protein